MPKRGGIPDYERDNSDDGSPSKKAKVNVVTVDGEEYADGDETCLYEAEIDEDIWSWMWEEDNAENDEDQGPPDVDSEQLHELDAEAEQRELDRLIEMSVLRKLDTIPEDGGQKAEDLESLETGRLQPGHQPCSGQSCAPLVRCMNSSCAYLASDKQANGGEIRFEKICFDLD